MNDPRMPGGDGAAAEYPMLRAFLTYHQELLLKKIGGLDDAQLRKRLVPSKTTLLGLVKHSALVHRGWFRQHFAGEPYEAEAQSADGGWDIAPEERTFDVVALYRDEVARTNAILDAAGPDDVAKNSSFSLRWILLHMLEETARHNGHADILREQIDGATGENA